VVDQESELIGMARESRDNPRMISSRGNFDIPVVLVPETALSIESLVMEIQATITSETIMRNVIGLIRGSDPNLGSEAVLFSAHLDHLGVRPGVGDGIFNGADDDATGVTAVVTLADAFGAMPKPKRTLIFMTFWGEESGLLGSKQFVLTPSWPLEKIVANVNIEMIGRPEPGAGGKIWMTGWSESNLGSLMNEASKPFGVEIFNHPRFSAMLYRSSDNWSFANAGVIAHSFSAGSLHSDYHQPDDEWDRLELPHMTRVIQGLFVGSLPLANGLAKPTKSKN
jgi:Zn-dependent M28 family amino/carboxypeptidase